MSPPAEVQGTLCHTSNRRSDEMSHSRYHMKTEVHRPISTCQVFQGSNCGADQVRFVPFWAQSPAPPAAPETSCHVRGGVHF